MKIIIHKINENKIAELISDKIEIKDVQDTLNLMVNCNKANTIIIKKENIHPDFFKLETKLAGEILNKFSIYNVKFGVIGDFSEYKSKSLKAFIHESNKTGYTVFAPSFKEVIELLKK